MGDDSGVRPVQHRREYPNPSKQKRGKEKKEEKDEETTEEERRRQRPPSPDGSSTIDLTA